MASAKTCVVSLSSKTDAASSGSVMATEEEVELVAGIAGVHGRALRVVGIGVRLRSL